VIHHRTVLASSWDTRPGRCPGQLSARWAPWRPSSPSPGDRIDSGGGHVVLWLQRVRAARHCPYPAYCASKSPCAGTARRYGWRWHSASISAGDVCLSRRGPHAIMRSTFRRRRGRGGVADGFRRLRGRSGSGGGGHLCAGPSRQGAGIGRRVTPRRRAGFAGGWAPATCVRRRLPLGSAASAGARRTGPAPQVRHRDQGGGCVG